MLISLSQVIEAVDEYTTESVTHGQCDARPTVTFTANGRYQFILLGEQRHIVCEQLAQSRYVKRSGRDSNLRHTTVPTKIYKKANNGLIQVQLRERLKL